MKDQEDIVKNGGMSIFEFYFFKLLLLFIGISLCITAYLEYVDGNNFSYSIALLSIPCFFLSDSIAMPTLITDGAIVYHRLWRISKLRNEDINIIYIGSGESFKWQKKDGEDIFIATGDRAYKLYIAFFDHINMMSKFYANIEK